MSVRRGFLQPGRHRAIAVARQRSVTAFEQKRQQLAQRPALGNRRGGMRWRREAGAVVPQRAQSDGCRSDEVEARAGDEGHPLASDAEFVDGELVRGGVRLVEAGTFGGDDDVDTAQMEKLFLSLA